MVFGEIKTIIEANFVKSYGNKEDFKENLNLFKENFLSNKNLSKMYLLYSDLSTPKGLNEEEAREYLDEGIKRLKKLKKRINLPKTTVGDNEYSDIDNLVYDKSIGIEETIRSKKNLIKKLTEKPVVNEATINLPLSYSVKVANKQIKDYLSNLDESVKKDLFEILSKDKNQLKEEFETIKMEVSSKLEKMISEQTDEAVLEKLKLANDKIKNDEFNNINFYRLKTFNHNLDDDN